MVKMLCLFYFFLISFALHVTGQESVELLTLQDHSNPAAQEALFHTAALVPNEHLKEVSSSILMAESWTRTNVLAHYPGINITTVVVGHTLLCNIGQEENFVLILPSLKNIHYTLTRWGLHKEIKVTASFSSSCINSNSGTFRSDITETHIKPLLSFLQDINSPYLVNPPSNFPALSDKAKILLKSHFEALKNLGFFNLNKFHFMVKEAKEPKPTSRKLSFITKIIEPFPARPTPLAPTNAPTIGSSAPSYAAKSPLPPMINPPYGLHLPPCYPSDHGGAVAAPVASVRRRGLWCVAKPSVPPETLQEALDYACGQGGANCEAIRPSGSCYYPNTVVAHASYAFNSYWQKTKRNGGTCGFGGTAMLIDSDPSYGHCRFSLA
ncbi:hypothetical protein ACH5RR_013978 [Cinchona calisaya]|uniref:X8 domain-containing protein n=1 Tax=Cinchona calisaya TaxID=153742 RepID=A0ABD3A1K0_9GENT